MKLCDVKVSVSRTIQLKQYEPLVVVFERTVKDVPEKKAEAVGEELQTELLKQVHKSIDAGVEAFEKRQKKGKR